MARAPRACGTPTARIFSVFPLLLCSFYRFEVSVLACGARLAHLPSSAHVDTVRSRLAARNPSPPPSLLSPLLPSLLPFPYFSSVMTGLAALDLYFLYLAALAPCRKILSLAALASEMQAPRGAQSLSLPLPSFLPPFTSPPPLSFFLIRHVYFLSLAALAINSKKSALAALAH